MLTSLKVVRMAFSCWEANKRSATRARRRLIGTRCSGRLPEGSGAAGAVDTLVCAAAGLAFCTSSFKTRPSRPDPCTLLMSTPFSAASFAAAGIATPAWLLLLAACAAAAGAVEDSAAVAGAPALAWASVSILANNCCDSTTSPS